MQRVALQAKFSIKGNAQVWKRNCLSWHWALFQPSGSSAVPSSMESLDRACRGHKSNEIKGQFYFVLLPGSKVSISTQFRSNAFWFYWSGLFCFSPALPAAECFCSPQAVHSGGELRAARRMAEGGFLLSAPMSSVLKIAKRCCYPATALQYHHTWPLSFLLGEEPREGC